MAAETQIVFDIPDEILVHILSFLELEDLLKMGKTNKLFHRVCADEQLLTQVLVNTFGSGQFSDHYYSDYKSILNKALRSLTPDNIHPQLVIPYINALITYDDPKEKNSQKVRNLLLCMNMVRKMGEAYSKDLFGINKIKHILFPNMDVFSLCSIKKSDRDGLPTHLKKLIDFCVYVAIGAYAPIELGDIGELIFLRMHQYFKKLEYKSTYNSVIQGMKKVNEPRLIHKIVKAVNPTVLTSLSIGFMLLLDKETFLYVGTSLAFSWFAFPAADAYLVDQPRKALNDLRFKISKDYLSDSKEVTEPIDEDFRPDDEPSMKVKTC